MGVAENLELGAASRIGGLRHEALADALRTEIAAGSLRIGDQLPTIRQLARQLALSPSTVGAAYGRLRMLGVISTEVGRGTFVRSAMPESASPTDKEADKLTPRKSISMPENVILDRPWRKQALASSASLLRSLFPDARDFGSGRPNPDLLPLELIRHAWKEAIDDVDSADLQYGSGGPLPILVEALRPRLAIDGIEVAPLNLCIGSSAQQLMMLSLEVIRTLGKTTPVVAVEEPGYPTIYDAFETLGARLIGVAVDEYGVVPRSLEQALMGSASVVLLTPRAHNPTGASWTATRLRDIADVLASYPYVSVIENDQFAGLTTTQPGSLRSDPRLSERSIYIRSFSKSIAPDLRIAVAVSNTRLAALLTDAKGVADGWTSRLLQRVLATLLENPQLDKELAMATKWYADRRQRIEERLMSRIGPAGGRVWRAADGVAVWVDLPPGTSSRDAVTHAARLGLLTAPGDPFYLRPGHGGSLRLNIGSIPENEIDDAADLLAMAILSTPVTSLDPMM